MRPAACEPASRAQIGGVTVTCGRIRILTVVCWWQVVPTILVPSNIPLYGGKVSCQSLAPGPSRLGAVQLRVVCVCRVGAHAQAALLLVSAEA